MQQKTRNAAAMWVGIGLLSVTILSGCQGKIAQCNVLIEVINSEGKKIPKMSTKEPASFDKAAKSFEGTAKRMAAVELKDEKLIEFRDEYKGMLEDLAKATRGIVSARDSKDPVKIKKANEKMESFKKREADYLRRLNAYCSGS